MDRREDPPSGSINARIKSIEDAIAGLRKDLAASGDVTISDEASSPSGVADGAASGDGRPDRESPEDISVLREESKTRRRVQADLDRSASYSIERRAFLVHETSREVEALRAEMEILEARLQEQAAEAEALRKSEVREIKMLAEGREQALRRSHAARLAETRRVAGKRLLRLRAQRRADVETLRSNQVKELARARAALRNRLAELEERVTGLELRLDTEADAYAERIKELESLRNQEQRAAEEQNFRLREERAEVERRLEDRVAELEEAVEEHEALRHSLLEELELVKTRAEGREARDAARDAAEARVRQRERTGG